MSGRIVSFAVQDMEKRDNCPQQGSCERAGLSSRLSSLKPVKERCSADGFQVGRGQAKAYWQIHYAFTGELYLGDELVIFSVIMNTMLFLSRLAVSQ